MDLNTRRRRAAYRAAHRGTKEMDFLLGKYADAHLEGMEAHDLEVFEKLISLPDPDLQKCIMSNETLGETSFDELIILMRRFHRLGSVTEQTNG